MNEESLSILVWIATMMMRVKLPGSRIRRLVEKAGDPVGLWNASERTIREWLGGPPDTIEALGRFLEGQRSREVARNMATTLLKRNVGAVWCGQPEYPERLRNIPSPPAVLFYRSAIENPLALLDRACVAIIGTRQPTPYGEDAARLFARDLTLKNVLIVSGLAIGVDTCAHTGALDTGGETVAVLANGIDRVYPRENEALSERIVRHGILLTELPPGTPPKANLFPARNRIISGLCDATVVVEAAAKSGTMITAGFALDQGRDVFAVPGSIFSQSSQGTNQLLKEGAFVLTEADDVLLRLPASRNLPFLRQESSSGGSNGAEEVDRNEAEVAEEVDPTVRKILDLLRGQAHDADGIAQRMGIAIRDACVLLGELESSGRIRKERGRFHSVERGF